MSNKIGVIGFGTMGTGIAQVIVENGFTAVVIGENQGVLEKNISTIHRNWNRAIEKEKITLEQQEDWNQALQLTTDWESLRDVEFVIEAVSEEIHIKKEVFQKVDLLVSKETILSTNTSGLSITEIASSVSYPERVIGVHFFNPAPVMKLVELIRGQSTDEQTYTKAKQLVESLGKETIDVTESPLFAVNRILVPMINEAIFVLQEGIASAEDIDKGLKLGANHPIGPLKLADLIGLDTLLYVQDSLYEATQDSKYRSAPLLRKLVRAGHLGRKTGKGFFNYGKVEGNG